MAETTDFAEKIMEQLTRHRIETIRKQENLNGEMEDLIQRRTAFAGEAGRVLTSVILPRIKAVAQHFENTELFAPSGQNLSCACHFAHTPRWPATVNLSISIGADDNHERMNLHQKLEIFPEFIDYERHCDLQAPLGISSDEEIGRWTEERLFTFLNTYLQLETHPLYQKDNMVTDPVCGMLLPQAQAADTIKNDGREIYFCSLACRDVYLREHH